MKFSKLSGFCVCLGLMTMLVLAALEAGQAADFFHDRKASLLTSIETELRSQLSQPKALPKSTTARSLLPVVDRQPALLAVPANVTETVAVADCPNGLCPLVRGRAGAARNVVAEYQPGEVVSETVSVGPVYYARPGLFGNGPVVGGMAGRIQARRQERQERRAGGCGLLGRLRGCR